MLEVLVLVAALASVLACAAVVWGRGKSDGLERKLSEEFQLNRREMSEEAQRARDEQRKMHGELRATLEDQGKALADGVRVQVGDLARSIETQHQRALEAFKDVRETVDKQLKEMREDNGRRLEEMRKTVDEKLATTLEQRLGESFKQVSERLELVHKGLGEMQTLATGVGDLKKVLNNVKTKGILGEYQLGNILEQLLPREQYEENIATRPGSSERVEFAIRMPGSVDNESIFLPIDSKFPLQGYEDLLNAREAGDLAAITAAEKALARTIENFAKDISQKYVEAPHTTDFGIMFLPIESLYAEVLRHPGVFETLQRKYHVTVTGPTTMSALLNSLQMGFRTLAVTKRSSEVWKILEAVKTEFNKFADQLDKVDDRLDKARSELEKLRTTRTTVMQRSLKSVGTLDDRESRAVLELPEPAGLLEDDLSEVVED